MTTAEMDTKAVRILTGIIAAHNTLCEAKTFKTPGEWLRSITKLEGAALVLREMDYRIEWNYGEDAEGEFYNTPITELIVRRMTRIGRSVMVWKEGE